MAPEAPDPVALLARAEELAAAGRALAAVDLLAGAGDAARSPDIDRRLVELRHAAWAELDRRPGLDSWPPPWPDPFPGEAGIPAIGPADLDAATLGGAIVHHGCLRVDGLLGGDDVAHLVARVDEAFESRSRMSEGGGASDPSPVFVPFSPGRERAEGFGRDGFVRTVDVPAALADLAATFTRTGVAAAVQGHLGERPVMIANKWVLRKTPTGKIGRDFHQDGAFLGEGIRTIDCWIALSDCGPGTGRPAIDLVPHRFDRVLPSGPEAAFGWSVTEEDVLAAAPAHGLLSPTFAAGDALFFDDRLAHRTSIGLDLGLRYAIESWFVAPSSYSDRHVPVVL